MKRSDFITTAAWLVAVAAIACFAIIQALTT